MNKHEDLQENLTGFVLGELGDAYHKQIDEHLSECDTCRDETDRMKKVLEVADCLKTAQVDDPTWQQARRQLFEAVHELEAESKHMQVKPWWSFPVVHYAAAAVLIIGSLLVLYYWETGQKLPHLQDLTFYNQPDPEGQHPLILQTEEDAPIPKTQPRKKTPADESALAAQLFATKDVEGLIGLLKTGSEKTKQTAAEYLGQIGDERAIDPLQVLADQWSGDPSDNPYTKAIEAIGGNESQ